jgi:hypothetical protein
MQKVAGSSPFSRSLTRVVVSLSSGDQPLVVLHIAD